MRYSSKEMITLLTADGWELVDAEGSLHHFKHPTKKGKVTVPHPRKTLHPKTAANILRQSGLKQTHRTEEEE